MPTSTADVFAGDIHGFVLYPASWRKSEDDPWETVRESKATHARSHGIDITAGNTETSRPRRNSRWRYDHEPPPGEYGMALRRLGLPVRLAVVPGDRPRGNGLALNIMSNYTNTAGKKYGIPSYRVTPRLRLDEVFAARTADAFHKLRHDPQNPAVRASYDQLIKEVTDQYDHAVASGFRFSPWLHKGQPYTNLRDVSMDAAGGHLWFYPTAHPDEMFFGPAGNAEHALDPTHNPLTAKTGHVVDGYELRANDLFRAVHDLYGHVAHDHEFGPAGEYNAWAEHVKTLSPLAQRALTTETHGQNSWVNFGPHLRRPDGTTPKRGDPDWVHPQNRPFADQKAAFLPPEVTPPHPYGPTPVQMELPRTIGGMMTASSYDKPHPLAYRQAASRLKDAPHVAFANMVDETTRRRLDLPKDQDHDVFTHVHGIGSWEGQVEPTIATVFHKPVDPLSLQLIGAEVGTWARQHGILVFSPHADGTERMLHMRLKTHPPTPRLTQPVIADVSRRITEEFNRYVGPNDEGQPEHWMPGRTILPDATGHSDVLVWVPPWEKNPQRMNAAFANIAKRLGAVRLPQYWPGSGVILGGTSPYSDEEAKHLGDTRKRDIARENYQRVLLTGGPTQLPHPEMTAPAPYTPYRRYGRHVTLRDVVGRFKGRLGRQGQPIRLHGRTFEDLVAHVKSEPNNHEHSLKLADHLDDLGDPSGEVVRKRVSDHAANPRPDGWPTSLFGMPIHEDVRAGATAWNKGVEIPTRGGLGHVSFTPHKTKPVTSVRYEPVSTVKPHAVPGTRYGDDPSYSAVVPNEVAHMIHTYHANPPEQYSRVGQPVRLNHDGFKSAISNAPEEDRDAPRLVYSDYLEDQGMPGMAGAMRKSVHDNENPPGGHVISHVAGQHPSGHRVSITLGSTDATGNPTPTNAAVVFSHADGGHAPLSGPPPGNIIGYQAYYRTADMDHIRQLMDELHPIPIWNPSFGMSATRHRHEHARAVLGMPAYQPLAQQLARSPAVSGAVVRGVYYAPGKMMPNVEPAPAQTQAAPPQIQPRESMLARIRRMAKEKRDAGHGSAGPGGNGYGAAGPGVGNPTPVKTTGTA